MSSGESGVGLGIYVDVPYEAVAFSPGIFTIAVWCLVKEDNTPTICPVDFAIEVSLLSYPIGVQMPFPKTLFANEETGDFTWQSVCIPDIAHGITMTTTETIRTVIVQSDKVLPPSQRTVPFEELVQWSDYALYSQPAMSNFLNINQPFSGTASPEQPTVPAVNNHFCMGYAAIKPGVYHIGFFIDTVVQSHRRRVSPPGLTFQLKMAQSIDHCSQTHPTSIPYSVNGFLSLSTDTTETPVDPKQPISPAFFNVPIPKRSRTLQIEFFTSEGIADAYLGSATTPPTPYGLQRYFPAAQFDHVTTAIGATTYRVQLSRALLGIAAEKVSTSVFAKSPDLKLSIQTRNEDYPTSLTQYKRFVYSPINGTTPWEYGPCPTDDCATLGITSEFFCKLSPYYYKPEFYAWTNPMAQCPPDNQTCSVPFDRTFQYELFADKG